MKTIFRLICCSACLLLLLVSRECFGQPEETNADLRLVVSARKQALLAYEPIFLLVTLSNASGVPRDIPGRWLSMINVEFSEDNQADWKPVPIWWRPTAGLPPLPTVTLEPGQALSGSIALYSFNSSEIPIFKTNATYRLRVTLSCFKPPVALKSAEVALSVKEPPAAEKAAQDALMTNRTLLYCLLSERLALDKTPSAIQEVETFVQQFPESVYSDYFRASYIKFPLAPETKGRSTDRITQYRASLMTRAPWMLADSPRQ
jgi:hypothetical protein